MLTTEDQEHRVQVAQVLQKLRDVKANVDHTDDVDFMWREFSRINPIPKQLFTVERMRRDLDQFITQYQQALDDIDNKGTP